MTSPHRASRAKRVLQLESQLRQAVRLAQALGADAETIAARTGCGLALVQDLLDVGSAPRLSPLRRRAADVQARRDHARQLRAQGWRLADIARALGYHSHSTVSHLLASDPS